MPSCVCPPPRASSAVFGVSGVSHSGSGERVLGLGWAADPHFPDLTASARETPPHPHTDPSFHTLGAWWLWVSSHL